MTPEEIAELKQLAEEAQKDVQVNGWYSARAFRDALVYQAGTPFEAEYLAAADPATILRLIAHVEKVTEQLDELQDLNDRALDEFDCDGHLDTRGMRDVIRILSTPSEGGSNE